MVWAESNYYLGERRKKEISLLFVLFGLYDLLDPRNSLTFVSCVRTYNSQVLLTRIEEVLPQVSLQVRWEAWYWLRTHCICTSLIAQRIFTNKRKGCWFKTQKCLGEVPAQICCWTWIASSSQDWIYLEAKVILQKEHITLLRKKGYAFGAFWRISLVTFFETLTFLNGRFETGN